MKPYLVALGAFAAVSAPGFAQDSTYTYHNDETCRVIEEGEIEGGYEIYGACDGLGDWTLYQRADDHGEWSAYSEGVHVPRLAYGGYIGNFGSYHTVVEWRLDDETGAPYATIHRYISATFETGDARRQDTLIITALRPGEPIESCHAGYVDATALADANVIARDVADRLSRQFDCENGEPWRIDASTPDVNAAMRLMH